MRVTAIVGNDTVKLPMHVPDGTRVEITMFPATAAPVPGELRQSSREFPFVPGHEKFSLEDVARHEAEA